MDLNAPFVVLRCSSTSCPAFNIINGVRAFHVSLARSFKHSLCVRDANEPCDRVLDGVRYCPGFAKCRGGHKRLVQTRKVSNLVLILTLAFMKNKMLSKPFMQFLAQLHLTIRPAPLRFAKAMVASAVQERNQFEDLLILRVWRLFSSGPCTPLWRLRIFDPTPWIVSVRFVMVWCLAAHMIRFITDAGHDSSSGRSTTQCTSVILDGASGEIIRMLWKLRDIDPSTGKLETAQGMEPKQYLQLHQMICGPYTRLV